MQVNMAYDVLKLKNLATEANIYDKPVYSEPEKTEVNIKKSKKCYFRVDFLYLALIFAIILVASIIIIVLANNSSGQLPNTACCSCNMTGTSGNESTTIPTAPKVTELPTDSATTTTKPATTTVSTSNTIGTTTEETSAYISDHCGDLDWRRVAFIDMTDPSQNCPQELSQTSFSKRSCGRPASGNEVCYSVYFPVGGTPYNNVCGRALAYRFGLNIGFYGYNYRGDGFNDQYVDGISLTHGTGAARVHIWTFASGVFQGTSGDTYAQNRCPCDPGNTYSSPPFVGDEYFCESVATASNWNVDTYRFYPNNSLWDGQGCESNNHCCQFNNPPWFKRALTNLTSEHIELRLCFHHPSGSSNIAIEQLEIYVAN